MVDEVLTRLSKTFPEPHTALHHATPLELIVAVILSAQCTDERVNQVTPTLFERYKSAAGYAQADPSELEELIKPTGFFRNKTKSLIGMGKMVEEEFGGEVPPRMEDLVRLPGVGRKTANIILGESFGINEGIAVDTHVKRVSARLGLTKHKEPEKIEVDLMKIVPQEKWTIFSHLLIFHGRQICVARKPRCAECVLNDICPSAFMF